jgi:hypothetical protein
MYSGTKRAGFTQESNRRINRVNLAGALGAGSKLLEVDTMP